MRLFLAVVLCLVPLFVSADIYKSVDSEGNVVFSDKPTPGAKKIPERLAPTYTPAPLPKAAAATSHIDGYYTALRFRKPASGTTVRDPNGALTIDLEVVPALKIQEGHVLVIAVDGNNLISHNSAAAFTISNLAPGPHTLKAQVIDATGEVRFSSDRITFTMQRTADQRDAKMPVKLPARQGDIHP